MGLVKYACGVANRDLGKLTGTGKNPLTDDAVAALLDACREVAEGRLADQFPIDIYQTGSGTSSNMNVNEVIAARATELLGGDRFAEDKAVHPNDHVNMGQSTNDTFPTAIHVAAATQIHDALVPALESLRDELRTKAEAWDDVIKIGRTHLADATPLRLGQEFGGFARQIELAASRAERAAAPLYELPVGGTAVGSGINTHPEFGARVAAALAKETGVPFVEAADHFEANADRDGLVEAHALLKAVAVTVFNVANDLRWLGSGPRCGFYEIKLPDLQPGSSIMPGKVNPVVCEAALQAAARVMGNDTTVAFAGAAGGNFQLNIMMPLLGAATLESVTLLANSVKALDGDGRGDRGQPGGLRGRRREEPVDGHQPQPAHRLRESRRAGEGGLQVRQDDPRAYAPSKTSCRADVLEGSPRPAADDRTAGVRPTRRSGPDPAAGPGRRDPHRDPASSTLLALCRRVRW